MVQHYSSCCTVYMYICIAKPPFFTGVISLWFYQWHHYDITAKLLTFANDITMTSSLSPQGTSCVWWLCGGCLTLSRRWTWQYTPSPPIQTWSTLSRWRSGLRTVSTSSLSITNPSEYGGVCVCVSVWVCSRWRSGLRTVILSFEYNKSKWVWRCVCVCVRVCVCVWVSVCVCACERLCRQPWTHESFNTETKALVLIFMSLILWCVICRFAGTISGILWWVRSTFF